MIPGPPFVHPFRLLGPGITTLGREYIKNLRANIRVFRKIKHFGGEFRQEGGLCVSKKKRRYSRRRYRNHDKPKSDYKNRHHLCYQGRHWGRGALAALRGHPYCIVEMPKNIHNKIHEYVGDVPAPRESSAKEALGQLQLLESYGAIGDGDSLEKRLNVLAALFDCYEQETSNALRKQLYIVHKFNQPS